MQDLKVTLVQTRIHWEDIAANLDMYSAWLQQLAPGSTDLVVLPEMFSTGFVLEPENLAETMDGSAVMWMRSQSQRLDAVVTGSLIIEEDGKFYNRLVWMQPDGNYQTYDKRHLFSLVHEERHYTPGSKHLVCELKGWRVRPLICYDLRFPVWCRNQGDYDLMLFVANWPNVRVNAWRQLLIARAIENQAYVVGVNRVGNDGNEIYHSGYSGLIEPLGENPFIKAHDEFITTLTLSGERLLSVRQRFPFLNDRDNFTFDDRV